MNLAKFALMLSASGTDYAALFILIISVTLYVVAFVFRFHKKKKRNMSNFLELMSLILFLSYTIIAHNLHFDFGNIPVFLTNLALTIFAVVLLVRKVMLYNK